MGRKRSTIIFLGLLCMSIMSCTKAQDQNNNLAAEFNDISIDFSLFDPLDSSEHFWKKELTPEEYRVLRKEGTERAFSGNLLNEKREGEFVCAGCSLPLFASDHKYKSGTGWPSFYQPIKKGVIRYVKDGAYGWDRVEVECGRCGGHLGHVFKDGPQPTGFRYCINSLSLDFQADNELVQNSIDTAYFAGGCFWCVEASFESIKGVTNAVSGYSGGQEKNPSYRQVSYGETGHAEAVMIVYNPDRINYNTLLDIFFTAHDPTQLNRQGPDVGAQYRSEIFYTDEQQKKLAKDKIHQLNNGGVYNGRIVTKLSKFKKFWPAEEYHQDYEQRNPNNSYIQNVSKPKIEKVRQKFSNLWVE